ncbi:conserved hypothetical protein [Haloferula helveola]|uniref:DUF3820 family protein n=1 Tax=Haloferula helveola TaxID=490095 RepID=A0ABN6H6Q2_9BACT|nr:conserved hypothetical protein [Haloferula helveola]
MEEIDREDFRNLLEEIGRMRMPFGMYGRKAHPPHGFPIHDLPLEYLVWFKSQGFPKGRLGELMEAVHDIKAHGMDEVFNPLRRALGGRAKLKPQRPTSWDFEE